MLGFKIAYIILFVFMTLFTIVIHPTMHKPLSVENYNFNIEDIKKTDLNGQSQNIQAVVNQIEQSATVNTVSSSPRNTFSDDSSNYRQKTVSVTNQPDTLNFQPQTVVKPQQNIINKNQVKRIQRPINYSQEANDLKKFERIMNESTKNPNKDLSVDDINTVFNVLTANNSNPNVKSNSNRTMTEQEEIIAWNKWRAALQNRVMRDSNVAAPLGTVFMFSCVVDKYGNISNINAWSTNPNYIAMAKRNVKPALAALQGQSILKFPQGTKRTSTVVAGSFIIATADRYASPSDYSDFERVK